MKTQIKVRTRIVFLLLNIVIPVIIGYIIYLVFNPEFIICKPFYLAFPYADFSGLKATLLNNDIWVHIRNFIPDICWAYSFTSILFTLKIFSKISSFIVSFLFCIIIELIQLFPTTAGTFDFIDLALELLACILSGLISTRIISK